MEAKTNNIEIYCKYCNKTITIPDSGSFHIYANCPFCNNDIMKVTEKEKLKKLVSKNKEVDEYFVKDIVEIPEPFLQKKTEEELWEYYHLLILHKNIEGAKKQAELIIDIINEHDKKDHIHEEKEIAIHISKHDISLFERYKLEKLIKYKKILEKYKEIDVNNVHKVLTELIIKKDKDSEYAKKCEEELIDEIVNMPLYKLKELSIEKLERDRKYLENIDIEGAK